MIEASGGAKLSVRSIIMPARNKWRQLGGIMKYRNFPLSVKVGVYKTCIKPVLMYENETWAVRTEDVKTMERTDMRMIRWTNGTSERKNYELRNQEEIKDQYQ